MFLWKKSLKSTESLSVTDDAVLKYSVDSRSLSAKARFAGCSGATVPGSQLCSI